MSVYRNLVDDAYTFFFGNPFVDQRYPEDVYGSKYLEVPVNSPVFEVPVFMLPEFCALFYRQPNIDTLISRIASRGDTPRYKSVDRYMRDVLNSNYDGPILTKLPFKYGDETKFYYGTRGAVFDDEFNPITLFLWRINRTDANYSSVPFKYVKPVLRITSSCFLQQNNLIHKFIIKRVIPAVLEKGLQIPSIIHRELFDVSNIESRIPVEIIIENEFPLKITNVHAPSVNTTPQDLLKVVENHKEELIQ